MKKNDLIALAYGLPSFALAAINALFVTFHIDLFLNVYRVSGTWLVAGEVLILVFSVVNEPLFGYLMAAEAGYRRHLNAISMGGALLALSFLVPFFPLWSLESSAGVGLHFVLSVYVYDALLAYVSLAHGALLADLTRDAAIRRRCNWVSGVLGACGSLSVLLGYHWWNKEHLHGFRVYCVLVACAAALLFYAAGDLCERGVGLSKKDDYRLASGDAVRETARVVRPPLRRFLREIRSHRNLWLFVTSNFLQVFNCHFGSNFLPIFVRVLAHHAPPHVGSIALGLAASLPHAAVALLVGHVRRLGVERVVRRLIHARALLAAVALLALRRLADAANDVALVPLALGIALFLVANKTLGEAVCRHTNLVISQLVDEDAARNGRMHSQSTLIYGVVAFGSKPGQSLAPLLAIVGNVVASGADGGGDSERAPLSQARLFYLCVGVPLACTLVQSALWSQYRLSSAARAHIDRQKHRPQLLNV